MLVRHDLLQEIAARLDLRPPNSEAVESLAAEMNQHFEIEQAPPPFEGVIDSATGVGKTFVLAAAVEYLAAEGVRNFAVVTPGRTILEKTVSNFTKGHPKSLLAGMETDPVVITSENFATASMRAAMDNKTKVKLFIFTVQSLIKPTSDQGRRTHEFQEGLGRAFYEHLIAQDDLIVFADEHHCYFGPSFSAAVHDLGPRAVIGLTATPHKKTPVEQLIYRYPLAAAIADKYVKTPVLVGRKDDRKDPTTKLLDGVRLLETKRMSVERYCAETGATPVNPVMLVIAQTIEDAEEYAGILESSSFMGGRYASHLLVVHSKQKEAALAQLETVEDLDSPVRIILSVGMLKEGWDVKNVYVIASMRASISDVLTEQTLGRGLRLPFGAYTGWEMLDTLEVIAHERYEDLLRKAKVINEAFIDHRTRAVVRRNAEGKEVATTETVPVQVDVDLGGTEPGGSSPVPVPGVLTMVTLDVREQTGTAELEAATVRPSPNFSPILVPELRMTQIESPFSLADITDFAPFRELGRALATNPVDELRRIRLSAHIVEGIDGLRYTELAPAKAIDRLDSPAVPIPLEDAIESLVDRVMTAPVVPPRLGERSAVRPILEAFMEGLGDKAQEVLSGYLDRVAGGLIQRITEEHRRFVNKPRYEHVVALREFAPTRTGKAESTRNRIGKFRKGVGYEGWTKSMHPQVWFDSGTERDLANLLDDSDAIDGWVRLLTGDLIIRWDGGNYNPDFIAREGDTSHWLIEVKADKDMASESVRGKREAAQRWANHVSADPKVGLRWSYVLASESDIKQAKGDWYALKRLTTSA